MIKLLVIEIGVSCENWGKLAGSVLVTTLISPLQTSAVTFVSPPATGDDVTAALRYCHSNVTCRYAMIPVSINGYIVS